MNLLLINNLEHISIYYLLSKTYCKLPYMHLFECINKISAWAINSQYLHMILLDKELIQNFVVKVEQPNSEYKLYNLLI